MEKELLPIVELQRNMRMIVGLCVGVHNGEAAGHTQMHHQRLGAIQSNNDVFGAAINIQNSAILEQITENFGRGLGNRARPGDARDCGDAAALQRLPKRSPDCFNFG